MKNLLEYDGRGLYAGAAEYYSRYRPPYPPSLVPGLRERFALDGRGRLLDLGCGPGSVAIALPPLFEEVLAVDPEPEMLAEAARIARERGVSNIQWRCARAEELDDSIGRFRVVSAGNSFHWMDRERLLEFVYPRIERDLRAALAEVCPSGRLTVEVGVFWMLTAFKR